jgi:hypothetical protein
MVSLGIALRQLAAQRNVAVLYTNHSVGGDRDADGYSGEETKPALGMSWRNQRAPCPAHSCLALSDPLASHKRNLLR